MYFAFKQLFARKEEEHLTLHQRAGITMNQMVIE